MHIYTITAKYDYDDGTSLQIATENLAKVLEEFKLLVEGHGNNEYTITLTDWQDGVEMYEYNYSCEENMVWNEKYAGLLDVVISNEFEEVRRRMTREKEIEDAKEEVASLERKLKQAKTHLKMLSD